MNKFAESKPILFEILLIIAAFILAIIFGLAGQLIGIENEMGMAIGRILAGILLLLVFARCIDWSRQFRGVVFMLPAFLFAVWNIANHFITKGDFNPLSTEILILGIALAIFEEVIFRGIFIHNLKASGKSDMAALLIPAFIFGLIHLTNAVNGDIAQALVQTGYAIVIGLVFGAIYIRTGDLVSVIIAHAVIDITNRVFGGADVTSKALIIAFGIFLALETVYAFWLVLKNDRSGSKALSE